MLGAAKGPGGERNYLLVYLLGYGFMGLCVQPVQRFLWVLCSLSWSEVSLGDADRCVYQLFIDD